MSSLKVNKGHLKSEVHLPSSKSYANRALILAALSKHAVTFKNLPDSTDVTILLKCLMELGLNITVAGAEVTVHSSFPACESEPRTFEVGEGGTTARFLATMLLLGKENYRLILGSRLKDRPWQEFIKIARELGAEAALKNNELRIKGPITFPEQLIIDCSETTQFATAFKLICPASTKVFPLGLKSSVSYWAMTEKVIQEIATKKEYSIPFDWSSAAYPMAFAALNHEISFPELKHDSFQADAKILPILKNFKAVAETHEGIKVSPTKDFFNFSQDMSDALDLVPALSFFLAHVKGQHELSGIQNLVHKESDRLSEVIKLLGKFEKKAWSRDGSLFIEGNPALISQKVQLQMPDDHRMVMTATLFLLHHSGGEISPREAVSKSYPHFFELLKSI